MTEPKRRGWKRGAAPALASMALLWPPGAARAADKPLTAEAAMENYRKSFEPAVAPDCARGNEGEEIIVCRRRGPNPNRLPLPVRREPGEPIPGEPLGGAAFTCLRLCPQPLKVDLIKAAKTGGKIIGRILHPD